MGVLKNEKKTKRKKRTAKRWKNKKKEGVEYAKGMEGGKSK